jgi:hypothetical protein
MSGQVPAGYYRDAEGALKHDRRKVDRRRGPRADADGERRGFSRRAADREFIEREHHSMIEEALTEFAAEHEMF